MRLTWDQVTSWRLERHRLARRAPKGELEAVVGGVGGIQAQVMSAAEASIAARVSGVARADVSDALWKRRTLVKTWAMRGTLHLLPSSELPLWTAALASRDSWRRPAWLRHFGLTLADMDAFFRSLGETLGDEGLTREELAARAPARIRRHLSSGWGSLLKPAASLGLLCFGPSRGRNVTFVRPEAWLGTWREQDPERSLAEVTRRWLHAYGPATRDDLALWWGTAAAPAGRMLGLLGDDVVEVDIEGHRASALAADVDAIAALPAPRVVRLLPNFDVYTLSFRPRERFVPVDAYARVFRQAGWISPVVLVDGVVAGVWSPKTREVELFRRLTRLERALLDEELAVEPA